MSRKAAGCTKGALSHRVLTQHLFKYKQLKAYTEFKRSLVCFLACITNKKQDCFFFSFNILFFIGFLHPCMSKNICLRFMPSPKCFFKGISSFTDVVLMSNLVHRILFYQAGILLIVQAYGQVLYTSFYYRPFLLVDCLKIFHLFQLARIYC